MIMSRTSIRNRHGDLTAHALAKGYTEQRAWLTVDMTKHQVKLEDHSVRSDYTRSDGSVFVPKYLVSHQWEGPLGYGHNQWVFAEGELEQARTRFKKEARQ